MDQIEFRNSVTNEISKCDKMDAGKLVLELIKIENVAKTEIDFLFECLQKKGCVYHSALFCLYVAHNNLLDNCAEKRSLILKIAKSEVKLFKEEIERAKMKLLVEQKMLFEKDPMVEKIGGNRDLFFSLGEKEKKEYRKKFNDLAELMVNHKSKLLNFVVACNGDTLIQDYDEGLVSKKEYNEKMGEYVLQLPEICKKYKIEGPAEIVIKRTDFQEK